MVIRIKLIEDIHDCTFKDCSPIKRGGGIGRPDLSHYDLVPLFSQCDDQVTRLLLLTFNKSDTLVSTD